MKIFSKNAFSFLSLLTFLFFFSNCGSSGNPPANGTPNASAQGEPRPEGGRTVTPSAIPFDPSQRWPGSSPNYYSYAGYRNSALYCTTSKGFASKADYCLGLADERFNDDCAPSQREDEFRANCENTAILIWCEWTQSGMAWSAKNCKWVQM